MTKDEKRTNKDAGKAILLLMGLGYAVGSTIEFLGKIVRMAVTGKDMNE